MKQLKFKSVWIGFNDSEKWPYYLGLNLRKPVFGICERMHRLISAFSILLLESIISKLATGEMSLFLLVSVAAETGLRLALSKTDFVASKPILLLKEIK